MIKIMLLDRGTKIAIQKLNHFNVSPARIVREHAVDLKMLKNMWRDCMFLLQKVNTFLTVLQLKNVLWKWSRTILLQVFIPPPPLPPVGVVQRLAQHHELCLSSRIFHQIGPEVNVYSDATTWDRPVLEKTRTSTHSNVLKSRPNFGWVSRNKVSLIDATTS